MNESIEKNEQTNTDSKGIIQTVSFILRYALGLIVSALWVTLFFIPFWMMGAKNLVSKWNKFMDSVVFNN